MVFSSIIFLFFFLPAVWTAYHLFRQKGRTTVLLVASVVFYTWGERNCLWFLPATLIVNYLVGLGLIQAAKRREEAGRCTFTAGRGHEEKQGRAWRRFLLISGIFFNLLLLANFKYRSFIISNLEPLWGGLNSPFQGAASTVPPLGISFVTFHALSYLIDIYQSKAKGQKNPVDFSLYLTFFPKMLAGPIVKYRDAEVHWKDRGVHAREFLTGLERFIVGLAKKVLIANPLAALSDKVFAIPGAAMGWDLAWLGITAFTLQIYFDFSGYTDMAVGLGKTFGFQLPENFNYPYLSRSVQEFWRRWHMTLSIWFRDYLYIPLGGNRCAPARQYLNLMVVFLLCGLWHGASWNFVIWGLWYGVFLILERGRFGGWIRSARLPVQHLYALLVILFGWVLFRADDLRHALQYGRAMCGLTAVVPGRHELAMILDMEGVLCLGIGFIAATPVWPAFRRWVGHDPAASQSSEARLSLSFSALQAVFLGCLFVLSCMALAGGTYSPFIYFKF
jgi:alginate O-acetyltransferase complex protein AlgI